MFKNTTRRFSAMLLALSFVLGLTLAGCSDGERDNGKGSDVTSKTIYYAFTKESGKAVSKTAEFVEVIAYDGTSEVTPELVETEIAKMQQADGKYLAETKITGKTSQILYTFYHLNGDAKVDDGRRIIDVSASKDGDVIAEDDEQEVAISIKTLDAYGKEATSFAAGDEFYVQVYADESNISDREDMEILFGDVNIADVMADYSSEHEGVLCQAKSEGTTDISIKIGDIYDMVLGNVTVTSSQTAKYWFMPSDKYTLNESGKIIDSETGNECSANDMVTAITFSAEVDTAVA